MAFKRGVVVSEKQIPVDKYDREIWRQKSTVSNFLYSLKTALADAGVDGPDHERVMWEVENIIRFARSQGAAENERTWQRMMKQYSPPQPKQQLLLSAGSAAPKRPLSKKQRKEARKKGAAPATTQDTWRGSRSIEMPSTEGSALYTAETAAIAYEMGFEDYMTDMPWSDFSS